MLDLLGWLILGGLIGWLGGVGVTAQRSRHLNLAVAMVGAVLGGLAFNWTDLTLMLSNAPTIDLSGLLLAGLGATCLLTMANVIWHGRALAPAAAETHPIADQTVPLAERQP